MHFNYNYNYINIVTYFILYYVSNITKLIDSF